MPLSALAGLLGGYFKTVMGFEPVVGFVMVVLFSLDVFTGVKYSLEQGNKFDYLVFGRAWLKLLSYSIVIGMANLLAKNVEVKNLVGFDMNYFEWLHYAFLNFVLLQLFISVLQNFEKLGWNEFVPLISHLKRFIKIKPEEFKKKDDKTPK